MNKIILFVLAITLVAAGSVFADQKQDKQAIIDEISAYADTDPAVLSGAVFSMADAYMRQSKLEEAIALYEKALNLTPDNEDLLNRVGNLYNQKMAYDKVIAVYKKLTALKPENTWYFQMLTNALNISGKKDDAAGIWKKLVADKPEDANVLSQASNFYANANDLESAMPLAEKAAKLDTANPGFAQNLANLYMRAEKFDKAEDIYNKILGMAKDQWLKDWANGELVNVYQRQNRIDEMLTKYEADVKADPNNTSKNRLLAELYVRKGENQKALEIYEKLAEGSSDRNLIARLADIYESNNKYNEAVVQLEKIVKNAPGEIYLFERIANLYDRADKKEDSKKAWLFFIGKVSGDASVYSRYAEALYKWKDVDGALAQLKKAQSIDPVNATYVMRSASMLMDAGRFDEAKVAYGKVIIEAKDDWMKDEAKRKLEEIANMPVKPPEVPVKEGAIKPEVKKEAKPAAAPAKKKGLFSR